MVGFGLACLGRAVIMLPQSGNRQFVQKSPSFIGDGDLLLGELDKGELFEL